MSTHRSEPPSGRSSVMRWIGITLLVLVALFHLQFAIQAMSNLVIQGILAFVAMAAFAVAAYRMSKAQPASLVVLYGTLPLFVLHVVSIFVVEDESPIFAVATGIAPALAAVVWFARSRGGDGPPAPTPVAP